MSIGSKSGDTGWLILAAYVAAWDLLAAETLSAAYGRHATRRKWLVMCAHAYVSAHLLGAIPPKFDPLSRLARVVR